MTDLELIVVEDPSESSVQEEVDRLRDSRLRFRRNENRTGLVAQRNLALSLAQGQLLAKADSDDISEPHRLQTQHQYLQSHPEVDVLGSALTIIDESGTVTGCRPYPMDWEAILPAFRRRNPIAQPAVCFRRSVYEQFGGYPDGYPVCQDYAYWSYLARQGVRFSNLQQPLVRYRQHGASIKATRLRETLQATVRIKRTYWADQFTMGDRLRIAAEQCLMYLPAKMVTGMFRAVTYRSVDSQA